MTPRLDAVVLGGGIAQEIRSLILVVIHTVIVAGCQHDSGTQSVSNSTDDPIIQRLQANKPFPLENDQDAIRRFQQLFPDYAHQNVTYRSVATTFRVGYDRLNDTLMPAEKKQVVAFGRIEDLDRDGDCWEVESQFYPACFCAYFTPQGELIFAWHVPEG